MKIMRKVLPLVICAMLVAVMGVSVFAAGGETNLSYDISATQVEIGDEITFTISNNDMTAEAFKAGFYFDNTKLEVSKITWSNITCYSEDEEDDVDTAPLSKTTKKKANTDGSALGVYVFNSGVDSECYEGVFVKVTFIAVAEGDATITLREETAGTDAFKSDSVETITVTINEPAPACDHTDSTKYTYSSNDNGTHMVICSCGHMVNESESCTGGNATCSDKAICEKCEEPYGNKKEHDKNNYQYETNGNNTHKIICGDCRRTVNESVPCSGGTATCTEKAVCSDCGVKYGELAKHSFNSKDSGKQASPADCTTPAKNYVQCDNCSEVSTTKTVEVGEAKGHGKTNGFRYPNNTGDTHDVVCADCNTTTEEKVAHNFNNAAHKCVCDKVETFTLSVYVAAKGETVDLLTIPYGANLLEVLAKAAEEGKIPAIGDYIRVNDQYSNGYNIPTYYDYVVAETETWLVIDEQSTMPGKDFAIYQNYYLYGWSYRFYNDEETETEWYVGAEYYDENGYWVGDVSGWYYIEENFDGVEGGAWYYFARGTGHWDNYSFRAEGITRVPYPASPINGITYAPDAETLEYCANKGTTFIDAETALFVFDENGKFLGTKTGLVTYQNVTRYVENGMLPWNPGFVKVDGELYYFIGDVAVGGNTPANGDTYIIRANGVAGFAYGEIYNFENGKLSGLNGIEGGKYYANSKLMMGAGLVKLDEGYIYVRSSGEVATGMYWVTKTNGLVNAALYNFGNDGILQSVKDPSVNGLVDGVYYKNGMPYYAGLIVIEGETYYVKSNGEVATGDYYITKVDNYTGNLNVKNGDKLTFNDEGKLQPMKDGIVDVDGVLYYYVNNHVQYGAGLVELGDGSIIYVRTNGQLAIGEYWPTTLNDVLPAGKYTFGKDGKLVTE